MSDDWDGSSSEEEQQPQQQQNKAKPESTAQTQVKKVQGGKKWEGEDDEGNDGPVSDWEESDEEEEDPKPPATTAVPTPPKKKGTLKQKLAEKEAAAKASRANGKGAHADDDDDDDDDDSEYDSDAVLDPREKARRDKEKEVNADLKNAVDLLGSAALGAPSSDLTALLSLQPRTKEDFISLSDHLINLLESHQSKPLYRFFVEHHARALALPLKDVEVRKVSSGLTMLANEKQKEQRDKASGKKKVKPKNAMKPALGSAKVSSKLDTSVYDEVLDDFGTNADDFM